MSKSKSAKKSATSKTALPSRSLYLYKPSAVLVDLLNVATEAAFLDTVLKGFINNQVCNASQWNKVTPVYADVAVTLGKWYADGIRLYACGHIQRDILKFIFSRTNHGNISDMLTDFFDESSSGSLSRSETFTHLASHIQCSPSDILFLGCNVSEVQAAKEAGYHALVVRKTAPEVAVVKRREDLPVIDSLIDVQLRAAMPANAPAPVVFCNNHNCPVLKSSNTNVNKTKKIAICVEPLLQKSAQKPVVQRPKSRSAQVIKITLSKSRSRAYSSQKSSSSKSSKSASGSVSRRYSSKSGSNSSSSSSSGSSSASNSISNSSTSSGSSSSGASSTSSTSSNPSSRSSSSRASSTSSCPSSGSSTMSGNSASTVSGATLLNNMIYNSTSQNSGSSNSSNSNSSNSSQK